jgi:hypothetical protein
VQVLLLTSTLKTKHRSSLQVVDNKALLIVAQAFRVGGEIPEGHLLITQEALLEAAVDGFLSEGPIKEVEVKEKDGETGKS